MSNSEQHRHIDDLYNKGNISRSRAAEMRKEIGRLTKAEFEAAFEGKGSKDRKSEKWYNTNWVWVWFFIFWPITVLGLFYRWQDPNN